MGDQLLVVGRREQVALLGQQQLEVVPAASGVKVTGVETAVLVLMPGSTYVGKTLIDINFRGQFGVNVLAIRRGDKVIDNGLTHESLHVQDEIVVQGNTFQIANLADQPDFKQIAGETAEFTQMGKNLLLLHVPTDSALVGQTLRQSQLGDVMGLTVLGRLHGRKSNHCWMRIRCCKRMTCSLCKVHLTIYRFCPNWRHLKWLRLIWMLMIWRRNWLA